MPLRLSRAFNDSLCCRRGGTPSERISTKPGASSKDWRSLLSNYLPRPTETPRENGNIHERSWRIKGTIFFRKKKYNEHYHGMSSFHLLIELITHCFEQSCLLIHSWLSELIIFVLFLVLYREAVEVTRVDKDHG